LYRLPEAAALLDQAVALAAHELTIPRDQLPPAWTHQGEILLEEGHFDEAEALFHQAIAADSRTFDAWIGLARSSVLKQNFPVAAEFANRNYELTAAFNRDNLADAAEAAAEWARYRAEIGEAREAAEQIRAVMPELRRNYDVGAALARYLEAAARISNKAVLFGPVERYAHEAFDAFHRGLLPEMHPLAAACLEDLGGALAGLKRYR
jgi:tetratricopeptide (TPR) repeat protein